MKTSCIIIWFIICVITLICCLAVNINHDPWYYVVVTSFSFISGLFNLILCLIKKFNE